MDRDTPFLTVIAYTALVFASAAIVATLVHELAHAALARAAGLRVIRFQLGPLDIRGYGDPRVRFVPSLEAGVGLVPLPDLTDARSIVGREAIATAAGPLANLAVGLILLALDGPSRSWPPSRAPCGT